VRIVYDPAKDRRNVDERGLSFARAVDFDFDTAKYLIDRRKDYGEERLIALGYLGDRLHVLCFVALPDGIRVISFRKANKRESARHGIAQHRQT